MDTNPVDTNRTVDKMDKKARIYRGVHHFALRMIALGDWTEEPSTADVIADLIRWGDIERENGVLNLTAQGRGNVSPRRHGHEVEVLVYRREAGTASKEELAARPWMCDILLHPGETHHAVADTAAQALHLATQHWIAKGKVF